MANAASLVTHLRALATTAAFPPGPFTWEHVYEMGHGCVHWALCDPESAAEGRITDPHLILKTTRSTYSGDAPETWQTPLGQSPRLQLIAELLTHLPDILAALDIAHIPSAWTTDRPTQPGWYVFRPGYGSADPDAQEIHLLHITCEDGTLWIAHDEARREYTFLDDFVQGQWKGPLDFDAL